MKVLICALLLMGITCCGFAQQEDEERSPFSLRLEYVQLTDKEVSDYLGDGLGVTFDIPLVEKRAPLCLSASVSLYGFSKNNAGVDLNGFLFDRIKYQTLSVPVMLNLTTPMSSETGGRRNRMFLTAGIGAARVADRDIYTVGADELIVKNYDTEFVYQLGAGISFNNNWYAQFKYMDIGIEGTEALSFDFGAKY